MERETVPDTLVLMGVIGRPHGVRGLVRVHSHTADPAALPGYGPFSDGAGRRFTLRWVADGVAAVSELIDGAARPVTDRDAAARLANTRLYVTRSQLPPPDEDEFYLADLVGLEAVDGDGRALGRVSAVHDYGAGASLEIGPLLIPFTRAAVPVVDIAAGRLTVSPPAEVSVTAEAAAKARA